MTPKEALTSAIVQLGEVFSDTDDDVADSECRPVALAMIALEDRFKNYYGLNSHTVKRICDLLVDLPEFTHTGPRHGRVPIPFRKKILMTLRYLTSTEPISDISSKFNVTDFSLLRCKNQVVGAISKHLLEKFLRWPSPNCLDSIARNFDSANTMYGSDNFPNIVGVIDAIHIPIETPSENTEWYYNGKGFSVILQAVCDDQLAFTDIIVGWPGRVHDAKVLKESSLWQLGNAKCGDGRYHIIGDAAYPLKEWLLSPYRDNGHLTPEQQKFNSALFTKRQAIQRAFSMLKGRFKRLERINMRSIETVCRTISAACILHNLCIREGDCTDDMLRVENDFCDYNALPIENQTDIHGKLKRQNITYTISSAGETGYY